jgi:hypothetical protein
MPMRYRELSETRKRQIRYGALAVAVAGLAAGLIFFTHHGEPATAQAPTERAAASSTSPASSRRVAAAPENSGDDVATINVLRHDEAVALVGDARSQAAAGNFEAANASLDKAEKAAPKLPETQQARKDIAHLQTPEGQFARQVQRARLAIDHDDSAAAEAALAEAARLKPAAPEIASLRASLQAALDKKARRETRIAQALARMRAAIARRDFGAADVALNEAERIDLQDQSIRRARSELARARDGNPNVSE